MAYIIILKLKVFVFFPVIVICLHRGGIHRDFLRGDFLNFQKPEGDLAIKVGVIDPPDAGGQTVQLHARERLLEQRTEAGQIETMNL